ncbi:MAG: CRTAC1 family protein [Cyclobacteriaceae bacterium]
MKRKQTQRHRLTFFTGFILFLIFGAKGQVTFQEASKDLPGIDKNLKKWGTPVFADLDQDGLIDMLLNDHGYGISVCWNENGKFASPFDIIMGDLHGLTTGDFDKDGLMEVVMSMGGGSGSNARNSKIYRVSKDRKFALLPDFPEPLAMMRGRTVKFFDGDLDGDLDLLNFAFPDASKNGESENYIYENDGTGQLVLKGVLPPSKQDGQKTLITDFSGDLVPDLLIYGHGRVRAFKGNGDLTFEEVTDKTLIDNFSDVTSIVEIDFDNDGDFDLFMTRGKEFEKSETFYDPETKTWGFFTKRGEFQFEVEAGDVLDIKNYLTPWPNMHVRLGESGYEYEFPGETHSGKDIRLVNSNCLGFPSILDEKGIYIGFVGNKTWRLAGNSWAPTTGAIIGVERYGTGQIAEPLKSVLLENKKGKFQDITNDVNLKINTHAVSAATADFNNDGWVDLVIHQRGEMVRPNESVIFLNQKGSAFIGVDEHQVISPELASIGMAVEVVDYNQDGKVDMIVCNERGKWHLFKNSSNAGNYLTVLVGNSEKNVSPMDAMVTIKSCDLKQSKRVGSTGSFYSRGLDNKMHFGLGECKDAVEITVRWSSGEQITKKVSSVNQVILAGRK